MPDNYIIDPSNQQGQPQNSSGSVAPANKATGGKTVLPNDQLDEGPEDITDKTGGLRLPGEGPTPVPNHPGVALKPKIVPMPERSNEPMGKKIGKDIPH